MVDLVHAVIYTFDGSHAIRDMPSDRHAAGMCIGTDSLHDVRLHGAVDLNLARPCSAVLFYPGERLVRRVGSDGAERHRAGPIDDPGKFQMRSNGRILLAV